MAQLIWWVSSSWMGDMQPGDVHGWIAWGGGLQPGDVVTVMAHPVVGNPNDWERILQVENIQAEGTADGARRIFFSVRNVGGTTIPAYGFDGMLMRP